MIRYPVGRPPPGRGVVRGRDEGAEQRLAGRHAPVTRRRAGDDRGVDRVVGIDRPAQHRLARPDSQDALRMTPDDLARVVPRLTVRGGLTRRTIVASAVLALLVGAAFVVLIRAVTEERDSSEQAIRSQEVIAAANGLERLVLDLETGQRGFVITRDERFLQPWQDARDAYGRAADAVVAATGGIDGQARAARAIAAAADAYVTEYSVPLVEAARRGEASARSADALDEGKRRVDAIRAQFDAFVEAERRRFLAREDVADSDARRAILIGAVGLAGSTLLIILFGGYLTRAVALPVRRAAMMAGKLAGGDLSTRMPETGAGEVGALERSFNTMASSLESSRDELRAIAAEQAALRRVATLVAQAVPASELFEAVTREVGLQCDADLARMERFEPDHTVTAVAAWSRSGEAQLAVGAGFDLEGASIAARVHETGGPARVDTFADASGPIAQEAQALGIRSSVGCPIVVAGGTWGVIAASTRHETPFPADIEERMAQFTELIATAIANAQSRAELAASRARVVATADETRRRIERDLHDGAQQSLVHTVITLKLARRALGDASGPAVELVDDALEHAERANDELRELAHGILPATLSRGLGAAIETLVSRVRMPVSTDVTAERVAPELEATAYFVVAEALTNTVKHARASRARVTASVADGVLRVEVSDDGVGGARSDGRSGLLGLYDRVAAMNGELRVDSPPGGGTTVTAAIPLRKP
jgi:signal transduction histidine kinase